MSTNKNETRQRKPKMEIPVSKEEKSLIRNAADNAGLSLAAFVRMTALKAARELEG